MMIFTTDVNGKAVFRRNIGGLKTSSTEKKFV